MPRPRMKSLIRRQANMAIWRYLRRHPELKDLQDTGKSTRVGAILARVRKDAFPFEKRKGWPYRAFLKEVWVFEDNWESMNLEWALWKTNPKHLQAGDEWNTGGGHC